MKANYYRFVLKQEHFTDLRKQNLLLDWWIGFRLEPIYTTAPAASKNDSRLSGQNRLKNNHIASLIRNTLCMLMMQLVLVIRVPSVIDYDFVV